MIELFDYQTEQVEAGITGKNINLSDVGTGKTFVGLGVFKRLASEHFFNKLLIICLASKVSDFASDASKMGLGVTALDKGTKRNRELLAASESVSVSFESVWRLEELKSWVDNRTMILIDESHKIKNPSSKVGFFVRELASHAGYTYQMTATPITNGKYEEWYNQLSIAGKLDMEYAQFKKKFTVEELQSTHVAGGRERYFKQIVGYKNLQVLDEIVAKSAVYKERHLSDDMQPIFINYEFKKPTMYGKIQKQRVLQMEDGSIKEYDSTSSIYHALRQLSSGVLNGIGKTIKKDKLKRLQDLLDTLNERVVIFYNYDSELFALRELMKSLKLPFSEYNGYSHDRSAFKQNENGVCLVQYKSGSTGKNGFQIASICVFFSQPNGSTEYKQAVGRISRIGQTKQPIIYSLITSNSVESKVHEANLNGKEITDKLMGELIQ